MDMKYALSQSHHKGREGARLFQGWSVGKILCCNVLQTPVHNHST